MLISGCILLSIFVINFIISKMIKEKIKKNLLFKDYVKKARTGDLIFFSTNIDPFLKIIFGTKWTHIAMVIKFEKKLLLWESTIQNPFISREKMNIDIFSNKVKNGVQLVPLIKRLENHQGEIAIKRFIKEKEILLDKKFFDFIQHMHKYGFEINLLRLFSSLDAKRNIVGQESSTGKLCSELIYETLKFLDILPKKNKNFEPHKIAPHHFFFFDFLNIYQDLVLLKF